MGHGLRFSEDLAAWRRWQQSQHRIRRMRHSLRPGPPEPVVLTLYSDAPTLLVALDSGSPTSDAALLAPLLHLDVPLAVLSAGPGLTLVGRSPVASHVVADGSLPDSLRHLRAVSSLGHYLARGLLAQRWSERLSVPHFVTQHGALTPYAPPLPAGARLLAWSEADAEFWRSGRRDVTHEVVGSQLLWRAGSNPAPTGAATAQRLTYLGQMHAAELSRSRLVRSGAAFCREHRAVYRPHPSERDRLSRATHAVYRRLGITVDGSTPLADLAGPVVSVFSTGVLEAAAQGRDAWVDFDRPPSWVAEFWERYGMHRFGQPPTPAPPRPDIEPAQRIAGLLTEAVR